MIETWCACGQLLTAVESEVHQPAQCPQCGAAVRYVAAEELADGAGAADFDVCLMIENAPPGGAAVGQQMFVGGVPEIEIGKLPDKHISLPGAKMVSRFHCKLARLDFGPSRWNIIDNKSTNGLFVNGQRVSEHELQDADVVKIGEYHLRVRNVAAPAAVLASGDEAMLAEAEVVEAPPALPRKATKAPSAAPRKLQYASPGSTVGPPLLGDADISWVMSLRNASQLMLWALLLSFLTGCLGGSYTPFLAVAGALVSWFAAWLLTAPEPGAPESDKWLSVRFALRVAATINVAAQLMTLAGDFLKVGEAATIGRILSLVGIVQTGLFLFYLRRLALRIPSPALALNIAIVGIGLCASLGVVIGAGIMGVATHSLGGLLAGVGLGFLGVLVFSIWYIVLLIWFSKSFS